MRINAAIRPKDDTRLTVYSETMITLIRPHSEQRTMIVWRSGPMSVAAAFRAGRSSRDGHSPDCEDIPRSPHSASAVAAISETAALLKATEIIPSCIALP